MNKPVLNGHTSPPASETEVIARELGAAFGRMVQHYREQYGLTAEEARQRQLPKAGLRPGIAVGPIRAGMLVRKRRQRGAGRVKRRRK